MKECEVMRIIVLDKETYHAGREIFLNMDENFIKGLKKVVSDKSITNSYSTVRRVLYEIL